MAESTDFILIDDQLHPGNSAFIPAQSSGLYYGAGCFETFCADQDQIFKFNEHVERLNKGLTYLGLSEKFLVDIHSLKSQVSTLLKANNLDQQKAKIRIQISLCDPVGYDVDHSIKPIQIVSATSLKQSDKPISLITAKTRVVPSECKPSFFKLSNMLHYRNAWQEAQYKDSDDALMLTADNQISETSIANIFWKKGNSIFTPSTDCDLLPGIMRNSLVDILNRQNKYSLKEGEYRVDEIYEADLVWVTNSVIFFKPVSKIDAVSFQTEDIFFEEMRSDLNQFINQLST